MFFIQDVRGCPSGHLQALKLIVATLLTSVASTSGAVGTARHCYCSSSCWDAAYVADITHIYSSGISTTQVYVWEWRVVDCCADEVADAESVADAGTHRSQHHPCTLALTLLNLLLLTLTLALPLLSTHHSHHLSLPHSFTPCLKPYFSINPSLHSFFFFFFFRTDFLDSADCLWILLSISFFILSFSCFLVLVLFSTLRWLVSNAR